MSRTTSPAKRDKPLKVSAATFARQGYYKTLASNIIGDGEIVWGIFYLYFNSRQGGFEFPAKQFLGVLKGAVRAIGVTGAKHPPISSRKISTGSCWFLLPKRCTGAHGKHASPRPADTIEHRNLLLGG